MTLRIACAQINPVVGDIAGNRDKILDYLRRARATSAHVVLFPELAVAGYPPEDLLLKPHFVGACEDAVHAVAAETDGVCAIVGTPVLEQDVFNAAAVCAGGEIGHVYRKIHLPNYGVFDERRYFRPGSELGLLSIAGHTLGLTICEDIWIADGPHVDCVTRGRARVILNISASPFHAEKTEQRERMLCQRAADSAAFVVFCNLVGGQDELIFDGVSCVIDPEGHVIARAPAFKEHLLVVDIDPSRAFQARLRDPRNRDHAANGAPSAPPVVVPIDESTSASVAPPALVPIPDRTDLLLSALTLGIRDYVRKNGFSSVLIGMSGGVDSALVAALACRALGADHVFGLFMPSRFSSDASREDAEALAANWGFPLETISIESILGAFTEALAPLFTGRAPDITEENIQARIRGVLLMAASNKFNRLVLTTGNKSEMGVGYATLYGDMCGAFAPIKDVAKTRVYELCRRINDEAGRDAIPQRVLTKEPTAELRENQRDSDALPVYDVLDGILELYVEQERTLGRIVEAGFDRAVASRIIRLVNTSEYKRRQAAPGIKITPLAFGKDRRQPITNRFGTFEAEDDR